MRMRGRDVLRPLGIFLAFMAVCTMLSRASSSLTVAVVQTASPTKMVISHKVTAVGKVEEDQEMAVSTEAGQKIAQIWVREGQTVEPGDVLLQLDLRTLKGQIASCGEGLEKIDLETAGLEKAAQIQAQKEDLAVRRAQEDYDLAVAKGDQAVSQAAWEWERAVDRLNGYQQEAEIDEGEESALTEAVYAAQKAYEEAMDARDDGIREAARALEDAHVQEPSDNTIRLKEIEAREIRAQMKKLKKIQRTGGKILSPIKGTVTKIQASVGEVTAETPLLFLADRTAGCRFIAQAEKGQEEYLQKGVSVTLTNEQKKKTSKDLTIDSVKADSEDPDLLEVCVRLPADLLEIGDSAKMTVEKKSGTYNTCIPIQALHQANGTYFVYVIREKDTVLGEQLVAGRVSVTVQEQNEMYAALDDGCLSSDDKVIQNADKTIDEDSPVRLDAS